MSRLLNQSTPRRPTPPAGVPAVAPALLDGLLRATGPATVEALALRLGQPVAWVVRGLDQLMAAGCQLQVHPQQGVQLIRTGLGTWSDYLRWACGQDPNRIIEVYNQTTSTQDAVRRVIASCGEAAEGAVAVADEQTAGRGRLGRSWVAPPGAAVTFSRACLGQREQLSIDRLTLATAVAVREAIQPLVEPNRVEIKWPNDLLIQGKKVAGILVEIHSLMPGWDAVAAVIGVGVNVTLDTRQAPLDQPPYRGRITSLHLMGRWVDRLWVLARVLGHMDRALLVTDVAALLDSWRAHCPMLSQRVALSHNGQTIHGQVIDLDPQAGLIVRTVSGTVVHLPTATTTMLSAPG